MRESPRCAEALRLVASVMNVARPKRSLAVVRNQVGARLLMLGERLDDLVLVAVQREYAALRDPHGALCVLPVFEPAAPAPTATSQPKVRRVANPPVVSADDENRPRPALTREQLRKGLRILPDGSYSLSRELLLNALKNPGGAAAGAYFKLREQDGQAMGMEVRGVRDGSTLSQMGIRTGDVVSTINGIDVSTPLGLLDALRTARESEAITLSIVRDGRERALRYAVQ